ncbi:single-stranded DNA-binding protein [Rhizosphaericola mali]|uniref:Single-stranded DNA-binding protein n=1 Tax=Rhizosphaericola mali TaxID=2545455 RepID=A0A5P2FVJ8_9BACT|nr:single-stranded DNA-binding protein [Rhizosphaericola mali]QES87524.1 single-stranded DNA-binding protein [Rhizosphaericola mali]
MIKLTAIGNLGRDCQTNEVNGRHVINFSIAHTERYKDQERTIWVECAYWTEKLGIAPYLKKGTTVYVEGTPDVRSFQTNDGRQGASLTLRVQSVQLVGNRNTGDGFNESSSYSNTNSESKTNIPAAPSMSESPEDDLPF